MLSDAQLRAAYDDDPVPTRRRSGEDWDSHAAWGAWEEFSQEDERTRRARKRKEAAFRFGVCAFAAWSAVLAGLMQQRLRDNHLLFPPPLGASLSERPRGRLAQGSLPQPDGAARREESRHPRRRRGTLARHSPRHRDAPHCPCFTRQRAARGSLEQTLPRRARAAVASTRALRPPSPASPAWLTLTPRRSLSGGCDDAGAALARPAPTPPTSTSRLRRTNCSRWRAARRPPPRASPRGEHSSPRPGASGGRRAAALGSRGLQASSQGQVSTVRPPRLQVHTLYTYVHALLKCEQRLFTPAAVNRCTPSTPTCTPSSV